MSVDISSRSLKIGLSMGVCVAFCVCVCVRRQEEGEGEAMTNGHIMLIRYVPSAAAGTALA